MMEKLRTKFSVCTLLREMLLNDDTIKELVGNQIYPIIAPEATQGNYIVYIALMIATLFVIKKVTAKKA